MTQSAFARRRAASWERLEALLARAGRRGVRGIDAAEVEEIGRLYRATTSDLAFARGREYDQRLLFYLNRLTARAHAYVYGASAETGWGRVARFYGQTFPQEFRRSFAAIAICIALTIASAVVAYAIVKARPNDAFAVLPADIVPPQIKKSLHDSNFAFNSLESPVMSSEIITNNVKVAIIAFGGCATLGILTIYIIVQYGLIVGGMCALFSNAGFGYDYWATIAPHGVIELTAIQVAGAAGLLIAAGILAPGRLRRRDAIVLNARRAGILIVGVASMLLVAGTIEGFFSPLRLPPEIRIGFGIVTALAMTLYFGGAGTSHEETDAS